MRMNAMSTTADRLRREKERLAAATLGRHLARHPELKRRYGERETALYLQDTAYHLQYLAEAVQHDEPALFLQYIDWARTLLEHLGVPAADLTASLRCLSAVLDEEFPASAGEAAVGILGRAIAGMAEPAAEAPTFLAGEEPLAVLAARFIGFLLAGDRLAASRLVLDAVESGTPVAQIYEHVFIPSQYEIGRLWQTHKISVAQEHFCTAATQMVMSQLFPYVAAAKKNGRTLVATCVAGELHEIGMRMVADFFEMRGWDTMFLGANMPISGVLKTVADLRPDLLAISATMTFHIPDAARLIEQVRSAAGAAGTKILVGGRPFNVAGDLWKKIGADACAANAGQAADCGERLLGA
jgi:methanogenic corrinoid protein MtbC1